MCFVNSRFVEQHRVYSRAETVIQPATHSVWARWTCEVLNELGTLVDI